MILEQIEVGQMRNFSYVGGDPVSHDGFVVDPAFDPEALMGAAKRLGLNINRIFLTHHHSDHVNGAMFLKARTGAKILAQEACERLLKGTVAIDVTVMNNETITIGEKGKILVLHTPGHSPGGICLVVADRWLVTGDTLFIDNCGRTDLGGGDPQQLFASLNRLKQLPDSLIIFPGHDYGSARTRMLGEEKKRNPALLATDFQAFDALP